MQVKKKKLIVHFFILEGEVFKVGIDQLKDSGFLEEKTLISCNKGAANKMMARTRREFWCESQWEQEE